MQQFAILLFIFFVSLSWVNAQNDANASLNVMTFNIRYPNPDDGMNYWPRRKELTASMIRFYETDIVGLQEAFKSQLDDLTEMLPGYQWFGVCRTSGDMTPDPDNEFSAILYKKDRLELLEGDTFWLSENPDQPGIAGWDADLPRIVTWARFKDKITGKTFYHFNTHFDHRGQEARAESAKLILRKIADIAADSPVVVTGDFNAIPESVPYRTLVDENNTQHLTDAYTITQMPHHGPVATGTRGFTFPGVPGVRIDYVFVKHGVEVRKHAILSDTWGGRLPSDHLPVLAKCVIP